ncbi:MAG: hypothetical protein DRR15_12335, partial [Gammaproteobacteria bacterium]
MKNIFLFLLAISLILVATLRVRYGGGDPYQDLSTAPFLDGTQIEEVLRYKEPIGNVAVSREGRLFFTV